MAAVSKERVTRGSPWSPAREVTAPPWKTNVRPCVPSRRRIWTTRSFCFSRAANAGWRRAVSRRSFSSP